jgi:hypothetical protein
MDADHVRAADERSFVLIAAVCLALNIVVAAVAAVGAAALYRSSRCRPSRKV